MAVSHIRQNRISIADPVQLYRVSKLHGQFRTAGGPARAGALRRCRRRQMLRTGCSVPVQRFRAEMRTAGSRRAAMPQSLLP